MIIFHKDRYVNLNQELLIPVWKDRNLSIIKNYCHPDIDVHTTFFKGTGIDAARESFEVLFNAFPIFNLTVEELIETPGRVTYKWSAQAFETILGPCYYDDKICLNFVGIVFLLFNEENLVVKYHSFSNMTQVLLSNNSTNAILNCKNNVNVVENLVVELSDVVFLIAKHTNVHLTRREVESLYFWVKGYSIKETAKNLGNLSGKTVQIFRENIRKKFEVGSYHQILDILHRHKMLSYIMDLKISNF